MVDLAIIRLANSCWEMNSYCTDEGEMREAKAKMMDSNMMRVLDPTWDAALDRIARNVEPQMFGASGTTPECVVAFKMDGNFSCLFVDVGTLIYECILVTS